MVTDHGAAMPRALLRDDALPLYARVAARLVDDLVDGDARPGDRLPSERRLTERYAVSRATLRGALKDLEQRRLVAPSAARGWFVADAFAATAASPATDATTDATADRAPDRTISRIRGFADAAAEQGLTTGTTVLASLVRPCTYEEGRAFRMAPGAELFELHRIRSLDGLVVAVEHNRLPLALCPALPDTDFTTASLWATLRSSEPPQVPTVADYDVQARPPSEVECRQLQVEPSVPLLVATQLTYNDREQPLELTVAAYRSDRYRFTASITHR